MVWMERPRNIFLWKQKSTENHGLEPKKKKTIFRAGGGKLSCKNSIKRTHLHRKENFDKRTHWLSKPINFRYRDITRFIFAIQDTPGNALFYIKLSIYLFFSFFTMRREPRLTQGNVRRIAYSKFVGRANFGILSISFWPMASQGFKCMFCTVNIVVFLFLVPVNVTKVQGKIYIPGVQNFRCAPT